MSIITKFKEKQNRILACVYVCTCVCFIAAIKLIYFSFNDYTDIRDEQNQQIVKRSNLVITKIIYEDPLLMTLLFQISFIVLLPTLQVYYFFKYGITPTHQVSNVLNLHKTHFDVVDTKGLGEKTLRPSLDFKKSIEVNPIPEEEDFEINDLQPFPQSNKSPDNKSALAPSRASSLTNINFMNTKTNSDFHRWMKILKSLKPVQSFFFGLGLNVIIFSIFKSISLIPFLDFLLMFNLSAFEILSLLLSCLNLTFFKIEEIFEMHKSNVSNDKNIKVMFKAFIGMLLSVGGCFLAASERKGTVLASTATSNIDPFIFNRLGGCLVLGLLTLLIGPLVILWNNNIMGNLYDLVHDNRLNNNDKQLYRVFSNTACYSSFRSRRNTLSMEMETIGENDHANDDNEQDLSEKELSIQFQSLLTFQIAFIATISLVSLTLFKVFMPEDPISSAPSKRNENIMTDTYTMQTLGFDTTLLTNILIIVPLFLFGLIYLSKRVKFGVLITLPMTIVCLGFLAENIFPSWGNGSTLAVDETYTSGETLGYMITGLGSLWGLFVYQ